MNMCPKHPFYGIDPLLTLAQNRLHRNSFVKHGNVANKHFSLFNLESSSLSRTILLKHAQAMVCRAHVCDTYGADWDFPIYGKISPNLVYMLASLPRSGSTYLASELWRTGVMGAPMEYANRAFYESMLKRLSGSGDLVDYWYELKHHRTSPNGVFGFKMFTMGYVRAAHKNPSFLARIAPTKVIFLTRSDLVAQAVSYSKAMRSGVWFSNIKPRSHPDYDATHIQRCIGTLQYQIDFWKELFALTGTCVHHVTYESILENPRAVIKGIADFLDVQLNAKSIVDLPCMSIQRDAESDEWIKRFKAESCMVPPDLRKI